MITSMMAEAETRKMITTILALPPLHIAHPLLRSLVLVCDPLRINCSCADLLEKFFTTNFLLLLFLSLHPLQLAQSA